jgi:peptidoglycan/LPS O-acetylase OafA/YrhL
MTYLGRISYGIYMFHAFFLIKMNWIYKEHPGTLGYITWCIVVTGGSIAVASLSYRFFETRFLTFKGKAAFKVIL